MPARGELVIFTSVVPWRRRQRRIHSGRISPRYRCRAVSLR